MFMMCQNHFLGLFALLMLETISSTNAAVAGTCAVYCEKDSATGQSCCKQFPITATTKTEKILTEQLIAKVNEHGQLIKDLQVKLDIAISTATTDRNGRCQEDPTLCKHGKCVNIPGDFSCICHYGYPGTDRRSCLLPKSCQDIFDKENLESETYDISPDGVNTLTVKCDMEFQGNKKMTEISHDMSEDTEVEGEAVKAWYHDINYDGPLQAIVSLVNASMECRQFMRYKCKGATITWPEDDVRIMQNPWVDRNGNDVNRFAGAKADHSCPCFDTKSCDLTGDGEMRNCNCDVNDSDNWREDSGYETNRNLLPVTKVYGSDTGADEEEALYTLGALQCWG